MLKRSIPKKPVIARMEPELYERMKKLAKENERSISAFINIAVRKYLASMQ